jgi:hypothetical protein
MSGLHTAPTRIPGRKHLDPTLLQFRKQRSNVTFGRSGSFGSIDVFPLNSVINSAPQKRDSFILA